MRIYLDHNATTPVRAEVADAMLRVLRDVPGNPSSVHAEGVAARAELDRARERVAALLEVAPAEIVFTAGAPQADNAPPAPGPARPPRRPPPGAPPGGAPPVPAPPAGLGGRGTENLAGIAGLGVACELARRELPERVARYARLRDRLWDGIAAKVPRVARNGDTEHVLANTLNLAFLDTPGELLLQALDVE